MRRGWFVDGARGCKGRAIIADIQDLLMRSDPKS
jgi:hypothetical protein